MKTPVVRKQSGRAVMSHTLQQPFSTSNYYSPGHKLFLGTVAPHFKGVRYIVVSKTSG